MMCLRHIVAVACGLCLLVNEASGAPAVLSKAEIMANMTPGLALQTVLSLNRTRDHPELIVLLHDAFGHMNKTGGIRRKAKGDASMLALTVGLRGSGHKKEDDGTATALLSTMEEETFANLEAENFRCESYDAKTTRQMRSMHNAVITFNAQSASARACVVKCSGDIATFTEMLQQKEEEALRFKKDCSDELLKLQTELIMVTDDLSVMDNVLEVIKCDEAFLLFQCRHCNNAVMLHHVPAQLAKLQSGVARSDVQKALESSYEESLDGKKPIALAQTYVEGMGRIRFSSLSVPVEDPGLNLSDVPALPETVDCQPTTKCSIGGNPNCAKLRGRFLNVATGLIDRRDELKEAIGSKQSFCEIETARYKEQIETMNTKLRDSQAKLAECTEEQNQAELNAHHNSAQLELTSTEYTNTMTQCCDNQNEQKSQLCALDKIRGELLKMQNKSYLDIVDCQVSEWRAQECSVSCSGGTRLKSRSILIQPQGGGMTCPPLLENEPCNEDDCPVDCQLGDWGGWSSCSADCGGGVMQRERPVNVEPVNGGEACEQTSDTQSCHIGSCDVDCVLSDWSDWSACSKACGGGVQMRTKDVATPSHGLGKCWEPTAPERFDQKVCDHTPCADLITEPSRELLNCRSLVDVVILLDGSASIGENGWLQAREAAKKMVVALGAGASAHVAFLLYGGPLSLEDYDKCVGDANGTAVNMETTCGMQWVSHFTNDTASLSTTVSALEWPQSTTMTSLALGQAESELVKGREDAQSVVILVTDGWPMSRRNTNSAATKLQQSAKVLYVPVGNSAPMSLIEEMASEPKHDHIIKAQSFLALNHPEILNKIIGSTCLSVY